MRGFSRGLQRGRGFPEEIESPRGKAAIHTFHMFCQIPQAIQPYLKMSFLFYLTVNMSMRKNGKRMNKTNERSGEQRER